MDSRFVALAASAIALAGCGGHPRTGHNQLASVPWQLVKAQGRLLHIDSLGGGCRHFDHTGILESSRTVQMAVYDKVYIPGPGEACTADAYLYRLTITLRQPLDGRKLLHAPLSPMSG
jgi:hypothetical protein